MEAERGRQVALVTGGGGDIGRATALAFGRRGYRVAICDLSEAAAQRTAEQILGEGGEASAYCTDIGDSEQVQALLAAVRARYGRVDVAFNNAGIGGGRVPVADVSEDDFDRCIRTNLRGTWLCMKYEILAMLEQGGGIIVNNCSINGVKGSVGAAYAAAKHGIAGLTKSAALAYAGKNLRVNAVCPGLIDAGLGAKLIRNMPDRPLASPITIPAGRPGTAEDVAHAVLWLSSPEAATCTATCSVSTADSAPTEAARHDKPQRISP